METSEFKSFAEKASENERHAQEIKQTRVGGLGGSDASLVYKIGQYGLSALSNSDIKRLAVMVGTEQQDDWSGNAYTKSGHLFEDFIDRSINRIFDRESVGEREDYLGDILCGQPYVREYVMEQTLAKNFKTFAHADFAAGNFNSPNVLECKYVNSKTTDKVVEAYQAQLQWYYMLGARKVILMHGWGQVEDEAAGTYFGVEDIASVDIERDDAVIKTLLAGIKTLDGALENGWQPLTREKVTKESSPTVIQTAYDSMAKAREMMAKAKEIEDDAKTLILDYMEGFGYNAILDEEHGTAIRYVDQKVSKRFDVDVFKKKVMDRAKNEPTVSLTVEQVFEIIDGSFKQSTSKATVMFK